MKPSLFETVRIHNGWTLKGVWIEEGRPQSETLYCKSLKVAGECMLIWSAEGFVEAIQFLLNANK